MLFNVRRAVSVVRGCVSRTARGRRRRCGGRGWWLERLEDRLVPAIITVTSAADNLTFDSQVTLREAIQAANTDTSVDGSTAGSGTDTIQFAAALFASPGQTITLGGGQLEITSNLTINGPGADLLSIDGNAASRIFEVGSTVTLTGLTLTNGAVADPEAGFGGGILNYGTLTITHSTLAGNSAYHGGGIENFGTLTISHSTLADNTAVLDGGGIDSSGTLTVSHCTLTGHSAFDGGGIWNNGPLTVSHSTIAENSAGSGGGGLYNDGGTATVSHSTLAKNSADDDGGGVYNDGRLTVSQSTIAENFSGTNGGGVYSRDGATSHLRSTIVAKNGANDGRDLSGTFRVEYSLIEQRAGATLRETVLRSNRYGVDPLLGPLADNGGVTQTYALLAGSPAINRGFNYDAQAFDQRGPGFVRAVNRTDIGAFEV